MPTYRTVALFLALLPIIMAVTGIKLMRDTLFAILNSPIPTLSMQFLLGVMLFGVGMYLFGGFLFHRDRKRNKLQSRFRKERERNGKFD
ncbi:DUF2627 domain-containing protein [Ectobacillus sp. sgz5001026]|uniref:DUF2627 domain-containing protein n=1 Tax=Ectobacillus sp. sgz5001026 TaxID=3242473 RepID=UPI0036D26268